LSPALTPELALAYLDELSTDIRESVVLGADGTLLSGSPAVGAPARELLAQTDAAQIEVATERGAVFAARSAKHAVAVVTGRFALPALILYDLRIVLSDLEREEQ
jgi:hypothetical protein